MATLEVVEGWTSPLDYTLTADGVAVDLTNCTPLLQLWDAAGALVTLGGTSALITAASGTVRFTPSSTDLLNASSPYTARWKVTDAAAKVSYFPNGSPDLIVVYKP